MTINNCLSPAEEFSWHFHDVLKSCCASWHKKIAPCSSCITSSLTRAGGNDAGTDCRPRYRMAQVWIAGLGKPALDSRPAVGLAIHRDHRVLKQLLRGPPRDHGASQPATGAGTSGKSDGAAHRALALVCAAEWGACVMGQQSGGPG